jgi:sensor histidine kinase YesM
MLPTINLQKYIRFLIAHRWLWHLIFWVLYAIFQARSYYVTIAYYDVKYLEFMLITRIPFVIITYTTLWLYRILITKENYLSYLTTGLLLWSTLLAGIVTFQKHHLRAMEEIAQTKWTDIYWNQLPYYITFFILLTMCKYFKDNFIRQYYESQKEKLQIQTELNNLKAQVSPHFLFNTMNNFYGLAVEGNPKLPALMVRLSELLRYSLYETGSLTVPLSKEIEYMNNYIELEKIRLEDSLAFEFNCEAEHSHKYEIAPLLFVVFVENAFKHAKYVKDDIVRIRIKLTLAEDGTLFFQLKNNCLTNTQEVDYNRIGIGLENVRKRLQVLYPDDQHGLIIEKIEDFFWVKLKLNLKPKSE